MKFYFNEKHKLSIKNYNKDDTVENFLEANQNLLNENPLPCFQCNTNCCQAGWDIELDIVFINRWTAHKNLSWLEVFNAEVRENKMGRPVLKYDPCRFLDSQGHCTIYNIRPFICRGYTCYQEGRDYQFMRDMIVYFLNFVLMFKHEKYKSLQSYEKLGQKYDIIKNNNLPLEKNDYDIRLDNLFYSLKSIVSEKKYDYYVSRFK